MPVAAGYRTRASKLFVMSERWIGKGPLLSDGTRKLVAHVADADGRIREEPFDEVPDAEAEARIEALIVGGQFHARWDDERP